MAEQADRDQRTEAPTPKRLADAIREGDLLQSRELTSALMVIAGAAWIAFAGPGFVDASEKLLRSGLSLNHHDWVDFDPSRSFLGLVRHMYLPLSSLFGLALLASIASSALLGSFGFRPSAFALKAKRLSPVAGVKRMFGPQGAIELVKALAKASVLGILGWQIIANDLPMIVNLAKVDIIRALASVGDAVIRTMWIMALGLAVIAILDVPVQLFQRNGRLRMTKQEVKDEARKTEGAPELKQAQRQRAHEILAGSARKAVTEATVILTNPTHFAVAMLYRPGLDAVPRVVARGRGEVALAIRALGKDSSVPVLEYPQLTRAIYFTSRAGQAVVEDLYVAVATVLAFVFNLEKAMADGIQQPVIVVPEKTRFNELGRRETS